MKDKKNNWYWYPQSFAMKEEDMFAKSAVNLPVVIFQNSETGEIKMFARKIVEKLGLDNVKL